MARRGIASENVHALGGSFCERTTGLRALCSATKSEALKSLAASVLLVCASMKVGCASAEANSASPNLNTGRPLRWASPVATILDTSSMITVLTCLRTVHEAVSEGMHLLCSSRRQGEAAGEPFFLGVHFCENRMQNPHGLIR